MTAEMIASGSPGAIFLTALLLTGRARLAEETTIRAFEQVGDAGAASDEELLRTAVIASTEWFDSRKAPVNEEAGRGLSFLPAELQDVLQLPHGLRQCFVLRVLRAMPRESCARLLGIDAGAVDWNAGLAAQALAEISLTTEERTQRRTS